MRFVREDVVDLVVAHDDVKIGFAVSDEVIYVLIYFIYFFISMDNPELYSQMIFAIDLKGELGQPIGYAFRSWWHFDCNFLLYYETDSFYGRCCRRCNTDYGHCCLE